MLTREEKEILNALREHMDDEQREAFDEMSEAEKKEFVKEAKKEIDGLQQDFAPDTFKGRINAMRHEMRQMSCSEFVEEYGENNPIQAALLWLIIHKLGFKKGCLTLLIIGVVFLIIINL